MQTGTLQTFFVVIFIVFAFIPPVTAQEAPLSPNADYFDTSHSFLKEGLPVLQICRFGYTSPLS